MSTRTVNETDLRQVRRNIASLELDATVARKRGSIHDVMQASLDERAASGMRLALQVLGLNEDAAPLKDAAPLTYEQKLEAAKAEAAAHGPYAYGDTRNPVAHVQFEESQRVLAEQSAACRYCKAAQTRAAKNHKTDWEHAMCSTHRERSRLNYVCSPVSETYWAS